MSQRHRRALFFLLAPLSLLFVAYSWAAPIAGVGVTASSELSFPGSFQRGAFHMVDGSGLSGTAHGTTPDGTMWLSTGNASRRTPT